MTNTIDNRVVGMDFDNKNFETNVQTSLKTVDTLKKSLNFDESVNSLNSLKKAGNDINFDTMGSNVNKISDWFSVMGIIGATAISRITDKVIDLGINLVKVATQIDYAFGGFREYEAGLDAFQTILANTASSGSTFDDVTAAMVKLNEYANLTKYSFGDMTRGMGIFTAQGVKLDQSITAIKGIYNIVSLTGGDAQKASSAVYQLSQAIASGTVRAQDWISVVNAGFGGTDFQNQLIQTAKVHKVNMDAMIGKNKSFKDSLQKGWLTSEILLDTLIQYTGDLSDAQLKEMGYTEEQIKQIQDLGKRAVESATKLKTFSQVMDTLSSNIVTSWADSFRIIFGDLNEATDLWTYLSDTIGGVLGASSQARNDLLQSWKDFGGRTAIFESLKNTLDGLMTILNQITNAFGVIFPSVTGFQLAEFSKGIQKLTENFKNFIGDGTTVFRIFRGLASAFDIVKMAASALLEPLKVIFNQLFSRVSIDPNGILGYLSNLGDTIFNFRVWAKRTNFFSNVVWNFVANVKEWVKIISERLSIFVGILNEKYSKVMNFLMPIFKSIWQGVKDFATWIYPYLILAGEYFKKFVDFITPYLKEAWIKVQEFATKIPEYLEKVKIAINIFITKATAKFNIIKRFFKTLFDGIDFEPILNFFKNIWTWITNIGKDVGKGEGLTTLFENIKDIFSGTWTKSFEAFGKLFEWLGKVFETVKPVFITIGGLLGNIFTKIGENALPFLNTLSTRIVDSLKKIDLNQIGNILSTGLLASMILAIKNFFTKGGDAFTSIKDILGGVSDVLDGVKSSLEAWQNSLKAKILMEIATALALMAVSLIALSLVDPDRLSSAMANMTIMFGELVIAMNKLSTISGGNLKDVAVGLIGLSVGMLILAGAALLLSSIDGDKFLVGVGGIGALLGELSVFLNTTKDAKSVISTGIGLSILAGALFVLVGSVLLLGLIKPEVLKQGLTALGALLLELGAFTKLSKDAKGVISTAIGLTIMSAAMLIMVKVLDQLASMSWEEIGKGLAALGGTLAAFIITMKLIDPKTALLNSIVITILSASMLLIASALTEISKLSFDQIQRSLFAIAGTLIAFYIALQSIQTDKAMRNALVITILSASMLLIADALNKIGALRMDQVVSGLIGIAGTLITFVAAVELMDVKKGFAAALVITILSSAMLILADALVKIGGLSLEQVGAAVLAIAGVLVIFAIVLKTLGPEAILGAIAIVILAGALAILVPVITTLGALPLQVIGIALLAIAGIFIVFGVAAALLTPVIPTLMAFALSLMQISIAVFIAAVALGIFAVALTMVASLGADAVTAIINMVNALIALMPSIGVAIVGTLVSMTTELANNLPTLISNLVIIVTALVQGILDTLVALYPSMIEAGITLLMTLLNAIDENIYQITTVTVSIITQFIDGIADQLDSIVESAFNLIEKFLEALGKAIEERWPGFLESLKKTGNNIILGIIDGIGDAREALVDKIKEIAKAALDAFKEWLGIASPSKEFEKLGKFTIQGYTKGLNKYSSNVEDASKNVGEKAMDGLSSALSKVGDFINSDIDMAPTIRPVIDLTDVEAGTKQMNDMMNYDPRLNIGTTSSYLSNILSGNKIGNNQTLDPTQSGDQIKVEYTQNNYSPKALSNIEIYRQTRNQLTLLKGLVNTK